ARAAGRARRGGTGVFFGEGGRVPVREVSGRRYHSRPGDEIDGGGDGRGEEFRGGFRQITARREREASRDGRSVHQRARRRQARGGARRAGAAQARVSTACDTRDGRSARGARHRRDRRQQGGRRPAAHRRHDQERRGESGGEYGGGKTQRRLGFALHPDQRRAAARDLLHHGGGRTGGLRRPAAHAIPGAVPS